MDAFTGPTRPLIAMSPTYEGPIDVARSFGYKVVRVPLTAVCDQCGNQFRVERFKFQCDQCGSLRLALRGGEELLLESVTFEETEA